MSQYPDVVVVVRHAEKDGNSYQAGLTAFGGTQAQITGRWLRKSFKLGFANNITTNLRRTRHTFRKMCPGVAFTEDWRINECGSNRGDGSNDCGFDEKVRKIQYRIRPFCESLSRFADSSVLIVAHSGSICAMRKEIEGISTKDACKVRPENASVTIYLKKDGKLRLQTFNFIPWKVCMGKIVEI